MQYVGYNDSFGGAIQVGAMQGYNYAPQPMMPYGNAMGLNPYAVPDAYGQCPPPQAGIMGPGAVAYPPMSDASSPVGNSNSGAYGRSYGEGELGLGETNSTLRPTKSFTGPITGMDRTQSTLSRQRSVGSRGATTTSGLARHGSVFTSNRERDTQVTISTRGGMSVHDIEQKETEDLKQYYGDMASRQEERRMDGLKAVRSYRGHIEDGEDVGKPRRVTNRRNVDGRSATGYGGINFKRKAAMRNGEQWGVVEVHSKSEGAMPREKDGRAAPQQPVYNMNHFPSPVVYEEPPAVPQVYNRDEIHSYSNLSDAFSADGFDERSL